MNIKIEAILKMILFNILLLFYTSCSKDSDLLADRIVSNIDETIVVNDVYFIPLNTSNIVLDVLSNDNIKEENNVIIVETTEPENGDVVINPDNTITYTPNTNEETVDTFTYTTESGTNEDGTVNTNEGDVTINITSGDDKPSPLSTEVAEWKKKFDLEWNRALPYYTEELTDNDPLGRYYDFRVIDGNIAMLQATGDTKYIDNLIWYIDELMDSAKVSDDGYYDWSVKGNNYSLYDGHGLRNIFKFLWILKKYPSLRALSNYQTKYDHYLSWFTTNLWDKWESRGNGNIMRSKTHMASHLASNMALFLYLLEDEQSQKAKYLSWVNAFNDDVNSKSSNRGTSGTGFRDQLRIDKRFNGYVWSGTWGDKNGYNDVSHANAEMQAVVNQYMNDIGNWTDTDINHFKNTLNAILDNSPNDDFEEVPYKLDAVFKSSNSTGLYITYGWSMLGRFDQTVQTKLARASIKQFKASYYYNDFAAVMAYNQAYLDGTIVYPEH